MFLDRSKRKKAEKKLQSATDQSLTRTNLRPKRPAENRKKQPKEQINEQSTIKVKLNDQKTLTNVFSKSKNKARVALYPRVSFTDSSRAKPARPLRHRKKWLQKRKAQKNEHKKNNDKFVKHPSDAPLTDHDETFKKLEIHTYSPKTV